MTSFSNNQPKIFTLAFASKDIELYNYITKLSSLETRELLGAKTYTDLLNSAKKEQLSVNTFSIRKLRKIIFNKSSMNINTKLQMSPNHVTFVGGKKLPLQSWFPYLEGYSPDFVEGILTKYIQNDTKTVYDPFSGTGTTPLVASQLGFTAFYSEVNPLLVYLSEIKFQARNLVEKISVYNELNNIAEDIEKLVSTEKADIILKNNYINTFGVSSFFTPKIFETLLKTRTYIDKLASSNKLLSDLITISILRNIVKISLLKRQGDLRFKNDRELSNSTEIDFFDTLRNSLRGIAEDIMNLSPAPHPRLLCTNAKNIGQISKVNIDAIVTSPPYLNGTNYFRNTKIELWFLKMLTSKQELANFRKKAVTAGINDVSFKQLKNVDDSILCTVMEDISAKAYDKRIPKMINDYFADMLGIFSDLRKHLRVNSRIAIDIGDSIYSNVHVPTDLILISLFKKIGYKFDESVTLRRRISKNGKELKQVLLLFDYKSKL